MRQCSYCGELIDDAATKCPFCGSTLKPQDSVPVSDEELSIPEKEVKNETSPSLSNGIKVLLSMVSVVPLIGQIIGIIASIIFMNTEGDSDKKSFGKALLIGTLIITAISCICCIAYFLFAMYAATNIMDDVAPKIFEQIEQLP